MHMKNIPIAGPWITQKEIDYVVDATTNDWYENTENYIKRFERACADYLGVKYALSLPSCTNALHLALLALDIGHGDEVILPETTWIATLAAIRYVGATPVFVDIDPQNWCISESSFAQAITPHTKAVIVVDLYGGMPEWDAISYIAREHNIHMIEDAAQGLGAIYKGKRCGSFGDISCLSFHGSKTITTGEGGLLTTDNEDLYKKAVFISNQARHPGDRSFFQEDIGQKMNMSSVQAALGLGQIEWCEEIVDKKRKIFSWYLPFLESLGLQFNHEMPNTRNVYWMVSILWKEGELPDCNELIDMLSKKGIASRPFFYPLSVQPGVSKYYEVKHCAQQNKVSYNLIGKGINLPSALRLEKSDVEYVCDILSRIIK